MIAGGLRIIAPVSYTHLDVYKRQTLHGGQSQFAEQGVAGVRIGAGTRQHPEPCEWIPAEHLGVTCLDQGIAQA